MAASAGFVGYIAKWGLLDGSSRNSIERMLDGSADRPFVYRQLVPSIARWADRIVPQQAKEYLGDRLRPELQFRKLTVIEKAELRFPYLVVYYLIFFALLASLFVLRIVVLAAGVGELQALVAVAALALAFPYLQTVGGYFYDTVVPLALAFAYTGELRNLSLLFVGFTVLSACALAPPDKAASEPALNRASAS